MAKRAEKAKAIHGGKIQVKEAILRKKDAHKAMCKNSTVRNRNLHKRMKNKTHKLISKSMRKKVDVMLTELKNCQH